jgi:hypothetical protein
MIFTSSQYRSFNQIKTLMHTTTCFCYHHWPDLRRKNEKPGGHSIAETDALFTCVSSRIRKSVDIRRIKELN